MTWKAPSWCSSCAVSSAFLPIFSSIPALGGSCFNTSAKESCRGERKEAQRKELFRMWSLKIDDAADGWFRF